MFKRVQQDIDRSGIIQRGDRITVGLSGGADSVCLLLLLLELKQEYGLTLRAVHVHHGLRGREADEDAAFVEELCQRLEVPLVVRRVDVPAAARATGRSEEEAGRELRYGILQEEAGGGKIATAHHRDDNCETILFNILRGTGLAGLTGIPQVAGNIIRPLLNVSRQEIEEYLQEKGQPWRTDATNESPAYTRNRIRKELLPWLEAEINAGTREHLLNLAKRAAEARDLVEDLAEAFLAEQALLREDGVELPAEALQAQSPLVQKQVLLRTLQAFYGSRRDIGARHLDALGDLTNKQVGATVSLPRGLTARRTYQTLRFGYGEASHATAFSSRIRFFDRPERTEPPRMPYTKWFDYDTIKNTLAWRTRQAGDRIALAGGSKTLQRFFIDEKVPAHLREGLPVLAEGKDILWIAGYRISERYKVTEKTTRIMEVSFRPEMKGEEKKDE